MGKTDRCWKPDCGYEVPKRKCAAWVCPKCGAKNVKENAPGLKKGRE